MDARRFAVIILVIQIIGVGGMAPVMARATVPGVDAALLGQDRGFPAPTPGHAAALTASMGSRPSYPEWRPGASPAPLADHQPAPVPLVRWLLRAPPAL